MSEHFSCRECTGLAPNSANYRESPPQYQASSSKHKSRFPKACHQVRTSVPPFMPSRTVSKTARGALQMVQKDTRPWRKTGHCWGQHRALLSIYLCTDSSWTRTIPDPSLITNHLINCNATRLLPALSLSCDILPSSIHSFLVLLSVFPHEKGPSIQATIFWLSYDYYHSPRD